MHDMNPHRIPYADTLPAARNWPRGYADLAPLRLTQEAFGRLPTHDGTHVPSIGSGERWKTLMSIRDTPFILSGGQARWVIAEEVAIGGRMTFWRYFRAVITMRADIGTTTEPMLLPGQVWRSADGTDEREITGSDSCRENRGQVGFDYLSRGQECWGSADELETWIRRRKARLVLVKA